MIFCKKIERGKFSREYGMNIAILMAQSDYKNASKLPACKNDLRLVKNVIEKSKKYSDILVLDDEVDKALDANEKIIHFLEKYKDGKSVDEILLYFSGHGNFVDNEFYYVWGDYEESKKRQTCLENSTIDSFLKTINAKLTIKIVDACQSGVPYLKGGEEFDKFLNSSKNSFNKCYFLFSSQNDEPSKASSQISYFTKSIIDSLCSFDIGRIVRYKDIMNYVSDEFERTKDQTPFFITQCDLTDSFIEMNSDIKHFFDSEYFEKTSVTESSETAVDEKQAISDLIKKDAERYVSFETVKNCLISLKHKLKAQTLDPWLVDFYSLEITEITYKDIPQKKEIGKWIQEKGKDTYTQLHYETVSYEAKVPKNALSFLSSGLWSNDDNYKAETKYRQEVIFFSNTIEIPYVGLNIQFKGKLPNLMNCSLFVVPILSRTGAFLLTTKVDYKRSGWDDQVVVPLSAKWEYKDVPYESSTLNDLGENVFHKVEQDLIESLKVRFLTNERISVPPISL